MRQSIVAAIKQTKSTYEFDYGHSAFGFVGRRGLDQGAFTTEHGVKFCRLQYLVDLDCLGGALKFAGVLFAFFLQPGLIAREQGDSSGSNHILIKYFLQLYLFLLFISLRSCCGGSRHSSLSIRRVGGGRGGRLPSALGRGWLRFELIFELRSCLSIWFSDVTIRTHLYNPSFHGFNHLRAHIEKE